jgi:hypothetical protein
MAQDQNRQQPDVVQLWRDWLTQSERQFNSFLNDAMGSDGFARSTGSYMELYVMFQRMMAQGMERYLNFMNMPSRTDIISLGETLRNIEARLSRIEETLQIAAAAVDGPGYDRYHHEPARTRRPAAMPLPAEATNNSAPPATEVRAAAPPLPDAFRL